jgi:hypothetical protein
VKYDFIAIPDADVPQAVDPTFQHVVQTYASETNKTASLWRAVPDHLLDFKPHDKTNPIRTILVSGGGCCTPATTARRCRPGCAWPGTSRSRRSTGLPAT